MGCPGLIKPFHWHECPCAVRGCTMKISTRTRYGTRMMLDLARHYEGGYIQLREIAENQGLSLKYLEQIIIPLRRAGFLKAARGARGGYRLAKPPGDIVIGEIVAVLEGEDALMECQADPEACSRSKTCPTRRLWKEMRDAMYGTLNAITLAGLMKWGETSEDILEIPGETR